MQLGSIFLLLVVVSALCVIVNCLEDVDRRDVHRIILKHEKSKKHKKRTKAPKTKPFRPNQPITSFEDSLYEPTAHASSTSYRNQRPQYPNHHDEYHDLIKPKPPRNEDATPYTYPEEEGAFQETASSNQNQQNYEPYLQNSDWNPITSTQLTHNYNDYHPPRDLDQRGEGATKANSKRNKRRKKVRRTTARPVVIFMTSTTYAPPPTATTTTGRPLTYREHFQIPQALPSQGTIGLHDAQASQSQRTKIPKGKHPLPQQHHYVNYNHNNKSHIRYEVSGSARHKGVAVAPPSHRYTSTPLLHSQPAVASAMPQPVYQTIHNQDTKFSNLGNSYNLLEVGKDYNKQIKQTSFKGTLVPQPVYPQSPPFLPTVSTYSIMQKSVRPAGAPSQLDFGKKQMPHVPHVQLGQLVPTMGSAGFGKLFMGGIN